MSQKMTKGEMLIALINHYTNGNKAKFASKLGISAQGLSTWIARNTFDIDLLYSKCEGVSAQWLLTGIGNMFMHFSDESTNGIDIVKVPNKRNIENAHIETRPRIPLEAAAGSLSILTDSAVLSDCEQIPIIPTIPAYDFTIIARGTSMEPDIYSGDELACRTISDSSFVQWGRIHVIDGGIQGIVVKQLYDGGDSIICRSLNSRYHDFLIPKEEVRHIALVIGLIRQF